MKKVQLYKKGNWIVGGYLNRSNTYSPYAENEKTGVITYGVIYPNNAIAWDFPTPPLSISKKTRQLAKIGAFQIIKELKLTTI